MSTTCILQHAVVCWVTADIYLICWLLWAISEYYCALFCHIDTLPPGLCLIDIVCFDNAGIPLCLLWPYRYFTSWAICLLGYSASWAILPLGLLCLLGLPLGLLCLLGLPLGLFCLLGYFASWAIYRHFASWAMSHRHCLLWQYRYTDMPLGLYHHWALISMQKMIRRVNMPNQVTLWDRIW
jgi:hypothetical protein